jgi:hypothetical protein
MRFEIYPDALVQDWPELYSAYLTAFDRHVFPTRVELDGNFMICRRPRSDSGKLHVACPVEGFGRPMLSTSSLPERDEPYLLPLELARGRIAELREQAATWELAKMVIPNAYREAERRAFHLFSQATSLKGQNVKQACEVGWIALREACAAADILLQAYTTQRLIVCQHTSTTPLASVGCTLLAPPPGEQTRDQVCSTFQAIGVPLEWKRIEPREGQYDWTAVDQLVQCCTDHRMIVRAGPLIDLSTGGLPQWLQPWERDYLNLQSFVCDWVETAVSRYLGRIRLWEVSAYGNTGGALGLSEENRLGITARTLETVLRTDDEAQLFIRIEQPWGDYQARGQHRLSPFQFVDAILRSNLNLAGVNLEINVGYQPRGCVFRDALVVSRLIDFWSMLSIQLHVTLAFPSSDEPDPLADQDLDVAPQVWKWPCSEETQARWIDAFVPMLMAKPAVTGVYWSHLSDAQPHRLPNAGLLRRDGSPKPAFEAICRLPSSGRGSS